MALLWVSIPLSECTIRASLFFQFINSGNPFSPSVWFAFDIVIGNTEAVAATPANDAGPVKKFLIFIFSLLLDFPLNFLY